MIGDFHCERCGMRASGVLLPVRHACTNPPSRGLGDTVAKVIKKVTRGKVKPCDGCKERQAKMNALLPFRGA